MVKFDKGKKYDKDKTKGGHMAKNKIESKCVKDNLQSYGASLVFGAFFLGIISVWLSAVLLIGGVVVGAIAMILESRQEERTTVSAEQMQDLELLVIELRNDVARYAEEKKLTSDEKHTLDTKIKKLEEEIQA